MFKWIYDHRFGFTITILLVIMACILIWNSPLGPRLMAKYGEGFSSQTPSSAEKIAEEETIPQLQARQLKTSLQNAEALGFLALTHKALSQYDANSYQQYGGTHFFPRLRQDVLTDKEYTLLLDEHMLFWKKEGDLSLFRVHFLGGNFNPRLEKLDFLRHIGSKGVSFVRKNGTLYIRAEKSCDPCLSRLAWIQANLMPKNGILTNQLVDEAYTEASSRFWDFIRSRPETEGYVSYSSDGALKYRRWRNVH